MSTEKGTDCFADSRLAMTEDGKPTEEQEETEIRVAITYRMERKKGEETAEDVQVVRLTRKRMELFKRAISPDATLDEIWWADRGSAELMVYALAKMRGWDDAWIVDMREAEGQ